MQYAPLLHDLAGHGQRCASIQYWPLIGHFSNGGHTKHTAHNKLGYRVDFPDALQKVMALASGGELPVDTERVPLANVENVWEHDQRGSRFVILP